MARKQHNQVRVVGSLLILLGLLLLFTSGKGESFLSELSAESISLGSSPIVLSSGEDGGAQILVPQTGRASQMKNATGNDASKDPDFQGATSESGESFMEFLGLYDSDFSLAAEILLLTAGSLLIAVSYIKR